jgi:molybdopterin synthase catalytic subunit
MKLQRRRVLHLAAAAAVLPAVSRIARAQTYPSRPITMIVPFAAGGGSDAIGRVVTERMRASLGQPFVTEIAAGANGSIGTGRAAGPLPRPDFDAGAEARQLAAGRTDVGAVVTFTGICRGVEAGAPVAAMTLEHYPGMAEAEIARHVEDAQARWPLLGVTVIHRYGRMVPGDNIVLVVTAASHRGDAFAAEFLMDYLTTRAPFWKKEECAQGTTWVAAKDSDDIAAERWEKPPGRHATE